MSSQDDNPSLSITLMVTPVFFLFLFFDTRNKHSVFEIRPGEFLSDFWFHYKNIHNICNSVHRKSVTVVNKWLNRTYNGVLPLQFE